jgi:5,10-methylenetetrahydromethanopterin reductase
MTARVKFSIDLGGGFPLADYVPMAKTIEALGFDEIHVCDDLMFRPAWPLLALMAANTERVRLGPAIITPRIVHPAYHAASLAMLDELSGGRATCAIGRGAFFEFVEVAQADKPIRMVRESVQVIRRLLAGDATPYRGEYFSGTPELALRCPPVRRHIPILVGTFGPKTVEMAGEVADGFITSCMWSPDYLKMLLGHLAVGARRAGRDPAGYEVIVSPVASVAARREGAAEPLRQMLPLGVRWLRPLTAAAGITEAQIAAIGAAVARGDLATATSIVSDEALRFFSVIGPPEDVIPGIERMIAAGANHIAFGGPLGPDPHQAIDLIGREILPHFRR